MKEEAVEGRSKGYGIQSKEEEWKSTRERDKRGEVTGWKNREETRVRRMDKHMALEARKGPGRGLERKRKRKTGINCKKGKRIGNEKGRKDNEVRSTEEGERRMEKIRKGKIKAYCVRRRWGKNEIWRKKKQQ